MWSVSHLNGASRLFGCSLSTANYGDLPGRMKKANADTQINCEELCTSSQSDCPSLDILAAINTDKRMVTHRGWLSLLLRDWHSLWHCCQRSQAVAGACSSISADTVAGVLLRSWEP